MNTAGMSQEEEAGFREVLAQAMLERNIRIHNPGEKTLTVEVVKFNRESSIARILRWCALVLPLEHYTSNTLNLRVSLKKGDSVTRFTKFDEIEESAIDFDKLERSMARRIASEVFMAKTNL